MLKECIDNTNNREFFGRSFRTAATFGLVALILVFISGERSSVTVAYNQPEKLAAIEAQWETIKGAPYNVLSFPITAEERNIELIMVPKLLSVLAFHDPEAEVRGLKSFNPEDRPPVAPLYYGYRVMLGLGVAMAVLAVLGWVYSKKGVIEEKTTYLKLMVYAIPLPYIAIELGWMIAEVGRQPWIVYHVMRTSEGVSKSVDFIQVAASLAVFTLLYAILGAIDIYLLVKYAKKGPDDDGPAIRNA